MGESGLTIEERRCLQMWFRQAIAKLEQEEVASKLTKNHRLDQLSEPRHRVGISLKRSRHTANKPAHKDLPVAKLGV